MSRAHFEQMKNRVAGKATRTVAPSLTHHASLVTKTILGIDPSLRGTGYGIIRAEKNNLRVLAQGTIACQIGRASCRERV